MPQDRTKLRWVDGSRQIECPGCREFFTPTLDEFRGVSVTKHGCGYSAQITWHLLPTDEVQPVQESSQ